MIEGLAVIGAISLIIFYLISVKDKEEKEKSGKVASEKTGKDRDYRIGILKDVNPSFSMYIHNLCIIQNKSSNHTLHTQEYYSYEDNNINLVRTHPEAGYKFFYGNRTYFENDQQYSTLKTKVNEYYEKTLSEASGGLTFKEIIQKEIDNDKYHDELRKNELNECHLFSQRYIGAFKEYESKNGEISYEDVIRAIKDVDGCSHENAIKIHQKMAINDFVL